MNCLSLSQPWADVMVFGPKGIENRKWATTFRGMILLQAAKSVDRSDVAGSAAAKFYGGIYQARPELAGRLGVAGAIIGRAKVTKIVSPEIAREFYPDQAEFIFGPYCWVLEDRQSLKSPFPIRGEMGLFKVSDDIWPDDMFDPLRKPNRIIPNTKPAAACKPHATPPPVEGRLF